MAERKKAVAKSEVAKREVAVGKGEAKSGVEKDDVSVTLANNVMTIKAESKCDAKEEKGDYHRSEIYRGSFLRTFTLPCAVDEAKAKASMANGILEIVAPKIEKSRRHAVKVE